MLEARDTLRALSTGTRWTHFLAADFSFQSSEIFFIHGGYANEAWFLSRDYFLSISFQYFLWFRSFHNILFLFLTKFDFFHICHLSIGTFFFSFLFANFLSTQLEKTSLFHPHFRGRNDHEQTVTRPIAWTAVLELNVELVPVGVEFLPLFACWIILFSLAIGSKNMRRLD